MTLTEEQVRNRPRSFIESRYPYTYAYDFLRQRHPECGGLSRAETSLFLTNFCQSAGISKDDTCRQLADAALTEQYEMEIADDKAIAAIARLRECAGGGA